MVDRRRRQLSAVIGTGLLFGTTPASSTRTDDPSDATDEELTMVENQMDDSEGEDEDESDSEGDPDVLQFVHLSVDTPPISVYLDGEHITDMGTLEGQDKYIEYPPGEIDVELRNTETDEVELTETISLEGGAHTIAVAGEHCAVGKRPLQLIILDDDITPTPDGQSRIRAVHMSPDAPAANVVIQETGETIAEGIRFGEGSYLTVDPGSYTVAVERADDGEVLFRFPVEPREGTVHTGFGVGYYRPENTPSDAVIDGFVMAKSDDYEPGTESEPNPHPAVSGEDGSDD